MDHDAPYSLLAALENVKGKGLPPIHSWHPENIKDIDLVIQKNGTWMYMGTPITRRRLVHLFSTVLLKEGEEYFLVTPVEKCRIQVEDVPFQAILLTVTGRGRKQNLRFTTDMAEEVLAGDDHPLRIEVDPHSDEPSPYILIRDQLEAKLTRTVYYQLADLMTLEGVDGQEWYGVWSGGVFFKLMESTPDI
ncbi:MAG: DUF1285 domain-containing protein [Pseudomonadales bacterium]